MSGKKQLVAVRLSLFVAVIGISIGIFVQTKATQTWWVGYDLTNCQNCKPIIDWSTEFSNLENVVSSETYETFQRDGVIILPQAISTDKVHQLAKESDTLPSTIMTDILSNTLLRQYIQYEHRLDSRSELIRDWAIHGPLGHWAAKLMGVEEVRLYNAEKIYSRGIDGDETSCQQAWHRDTIAAPFPMATPSITFNVYLDDISGDNDALIYIAGSHHDLSKPPPSVDNPWEPNLKVGDILAHVPTIYHTPSGRGCWRRRSLQFRYVAGPTTFEFGPNRFPYGPIPWTLAHAPGIAPHNFNATTTNAAGNNNSPPPMLEGPLYPLVVPAPLESEHVAFPGSSWSFLDLVRVGKESQDLLHELKIGQPYGENNCTIDDDDINNNKNNTASPAYFGFDGPVTQCDGWELVAGAVPVHKDGQLKHTL